MAQNNQKTLHAMGVMKTKLSEYTAIGSFSGMGKLAPRLTSSQPAGTEKSASPSSGPGPVIERLSEAATVSEATLKPKE